MARLRMAGFQKPEKVVGTKKVSVGVVSYQTAQSVRCNCAWTYKHQRNKVLEDAIDKHIRTKHGGQGFRM